MATVASKSVTVAEFLEWDGDTHTHHELVRDQRVGMALPSEHRSPLVANLTIRIGSCLTSPCAVVGQAGIVVPGRNGADYEDHLAVTCAPPERGRCRLAEPVAIVEVLFPSTVQHDRGTNLPDYRDLPSVRAILHRANTFRAVTSEHDGHL